MALLIVQAECAKCHVRCAVSALSDHGLCCQCDSKAEELHAERVFRLRPISEQQAILDWAETLVAAIKGRVPNGFHAA